MTDVGANGIADVTVALPPGLHPNDQSGPEFVPGGRQLEQPAFKRTTAPFGVENSQALPVNQRAAKQFTAQTYTLNSQTGSLEIAGGVEKGRTSLTLWVPATATQGVQFSESRSKTDANAGVVLNPGDSITIPSEAACWIALISGQTTGTVNTLDAFNPPIVEPGE